MNTLHTFGCSYTAFYETSSNRPDFIKYKEYKGGKYPKIWPELLSEKLNLRLNNPADGGSSNYDIFQSLCDNVDKFQKGDVIIVGWSYKERFRLVSYSDRMFRKVGPNFDIGHLDNITANTVEEILFNRCHSTWVEEIRSWEKIIKKLCASLEIQVLFWSFDPDIGEKNFKYRLVKLGAETIAIETKGKINDHHLGEQGHRVQCNHLLYLLNKLTNKELI